MPVRENFLLDLRESADIPDLADAQSALFQRASLLPAKDRALLELVLRDNASLRQLARVIGQPPGTVTRRLRRLVNRLHDPLVVTLFDRRNPLPREYRQLAIAHLLRGRSVPELADHHQLPAAQVRQMLAFVRGWHRGITGRREKLRLRRLARAMEQTEIASPV